MVSPKSQYNLIIENTDAKNEDQLKILNTLIENSSCIQELIEYHSKRSFLYFDMEKWSNALLDIDFVEKHNGMNESLLLVKWKSNLYVEIGKIRDAARNTLNMNMFDNVNYLDFLRSISTENIHDLIGNKNKKRPPLKRLRK